jgi:hypothetical protein
MAQTTKQVVFDPNLCTRNRNAWTAEQIEPYLGLWVAWSLDGTRIIASHADPLEVVRAVADLGFSSEETLMERLPSEDEVGGFS